MAAVSDENGLAGAKQADQNGPALRSYRFM